MISRIDYDAVHWMQYSTQSQYVSRECSSILSTKDDTIHLEVYECWDRRSDYKAHADALTNLHPYLAHEAAKFEVSYNMH